MRRESEVAAVAETIKDQLRVAIEEKSLSTTSDTELDLLILSLLDKLETLLWVLERADMETAVMPHPQH